MERKEVKKILNAALSAFLDKIDACERDSSDELEANLDMSHDEMKEAIDIFKRDFVIVPEGDPGLRMVETEIKL